MSKNTFQDIVKIKNSPKISINQKKIFHSDIKKNTPIPLNLSNTKEKRSVSNNMLWFVALISVIFLFFAMSFLFSTATITINPKIKDFVLNKTIVATKSTNTDVLSYDLVSLSGEEVKEISGGEEKDWEVYAKGSILIYNTFSASPQALSENTRLEGSNGKIYKTKNKVIIPGMLKNKTPGKIGVEIYGEKAGEYFNSGPLDFKILGFKGTAKYQKFYARSVGDITGGLIGKSRQVSDIDKENAIKELKDILFKKLLEKAKNQTPKNFVLLNNAAYINIDEENIVPAKVLNNFSISIKGTFYGILFNKNKLEKEIINESLDKNENVDVFVSNIEDLSVASFDKSLITLDEVKEMTFNLSGTAKIVWNIDKEKLVADLLGKSKNDFNQILTQYTNINSANLIIKPIWRSSIPNKSKSIKVIIN